jgi:hypothetical protein
MGWGKMVSFTNSEFNSLMHVWSLAMCIELIILKFPVLYFFITISKLGKLEL